MRYEATAQSKTSRTKHGKRRARGTKTKTQHEKDGSASPTPEPKRHTTSSNRRDFTSTFLDLPAELRNEIYALSLPEYEVLDIAHGMPSLLFTHPQIFKEASPIFLGRNTFTAHIKDRHDAALTGWLGLVKDLPEEHRAEIPELAIAFEGEIFDFHGGERKWGYDPDLEYWNALVMRIRDAGLTAEQLTWPGLQSDFFARVPFDSSRDQIVSKALLNRYVLTPLLRHHDLLDPTKPPVDVRKQVSDEWQSLGLSREQRNAVLLFWVPRRTSGGGRADPERWFQYWLAGREEAKADLRKAWRRVAWKGIGRY